MTDFLLETETVTWGKSGQKSLTIRGLNGEDLTYAVTRHRKELDEMFKLFEASESTPIEQVGLQMLNTFPEVISLLIALATDKPELASTIRKLPFPVQLKLMMGVYRLTIEEAGGLQDFLAIVFALIEKMKTMTHWLNSKSAQGANTGTLQSGA